LKKVLAALLAVSLVLSLTACSSSASKAESSEDSASSLVSASESSVPEAAQPVTSDESSAASSDDIPVFSSVIDDNGYFTGITASDIATIPDYKGIAIPAENHQVSDEEVQTKIDSILSNYKTETQVKDRAVKDGDTVNIDYVGTIDGQEFQGGNTNGQGTQVTIGTTKYIDDFLEQLIGHKPGETFDVNVTFPDDYGQEDLNGKDAVFKTTINYIVEESVPELTDEFVTSNLTGYSDAQDVIDKTRQDLVYQKEQTYIQDYLMQNSTFKDIPQSLYDYQNDCITTFYSAYASAYGMTLDQFVQSYVGADSMKDYLDSVQDQNDTAIKTALIYQAIAEKEGIKSTEQDVVDYLTKEVKNDDVDTYTSQYGMPYLKQVVLDWTAFHVIVDNAKLQ